MTDHIHRVRRGRYKTGTYYFQCMSCPFIATSLQMANHVVECWRCGQPFKMSRNDTRWAKPVCQQCRSGKALTPEGLVGSALEELLKEDK